MSPHDVRAKTLKVKVKSSCCLISSKTSFVFNKSCAHTHMLHAQFRWLHTAQLIRGCVHAWFKRFQDVKMYVQCACRDSTSRLLRSDVSPICSAAFRQSFRSSTSSSHTHGTLAAFTQIPNRGPAQSHISEDDLGYMAKSQPLAGYEPNLLDNMVPAVDDVTLINVLERQCL